MEINLKNFKKWLPDSIELYRDTFYGGIIKSLSTNDPGPMQEYYGFSKIIHIYFLFWDLQFCWDVE